MVNLLLQWVGGGVLGDILCFHIDAGFANLVCLS